MEINVRKDIWLGKICEGYQRPSMVIFVKRKENTMEVGSSNNSIVLLSLVMVCADCKFLVY